jgi:hypothetical protein
MKKIYLSILIAFVANTTQSQVLPVKDQYLGEVPPSEIPKAFPLKTDSGYFAAERVAITKDGKEIYYSQIKGYYPETGLSVKRYIYKNGKWCGPFVVFEGYAAPAFSITEDTMYVEYNFKTFMSVKKRGKWSEPRRVLMNIDSAHYYQSTSEGEYFVSARTKNGSGMADWCKVVSNGHDTTAISLGEPLNTRRDDLDYYISADKSFIIVTNRPGLAVSFKNSDGSWTTPKSLGPAINFGLGSWGPYITNDRKYLFYTTGTKPDYSDVQIYWVRIDGIIPTI